MSKNPIFLGLDRPCTPILFAVERKEGRKVVEKYGRCIEEGREEEKLEVMKEGRQSGRKKGRKGRRKGWKEGRQEGSKEGRKI